MSRHGTLRSSVQPGLSQLSVAISCRRLTGRSSDGNIVTQTQFVKTTGWIGPVLRWGILGAAVGIVAGCGLNGFTSGLGSGSVFGAGSSSPSAPVETASVNEDALLAAAKGEGTYSGTLGEVSASCPRVTVLSRDNHVTIYEPGRAGDGLFVMHRGELSRTARECKIEGGRITVKYGFSGRVLLGPKGRNGTILLPVNVAVTDAKREAVKSENVKIETAVTVDKPIGYFSVVRIVTFDMPIGSRPGEFELVVGFDRNVPGAG